MRLYNRFSGDVEALDLGDEVKLYVCGVTPYDTTHLGHARTYLVHDVLVRRLLRAGKKVDYVQNITDIDDSIVARAEELGEPYDRLGERYTAIYMDDIARLGMLPARCYPRATDALREIVTMIEGLFEDGFAYLAGRNVYFRVARADRYGKLSRLPRSAMIDIEREQDSSTVDDPDKEDPLDLLLWRGVEGQPSWDSPWGPGRPGWHIECSALAITHLGATLDIHGGGDDLVFPHHDAEIAQSEAYTGAAFARYWLHVAMVNLGGSKMSKSDGNMVFVRDLLDEHSADAIRLYLLGTHYRSPLDFEPADLKEAGILARDVARAASRDTSGRGRQPRDLEGEFASALDDDLDTVRAIEVLVGTARRILESSAPPGYEMRRALRTMAMGLGLQLGTEPNPIT